MKTHMMIAGIALAALPALAQAQSTVTVSGQAKAEARTEGSRVHGQAALEATAAAGLPEAPVRRTIAEGDAKGASSAAIDRAAMSTHTRLRVAREALSRDGERARRASDAEIVAGADAMASGATAAELRTLRDSAPERRSLTASLTALGELRGSGAGADAAASIAARLRGGASDAAIASLAASATSAASLGAGVAAGTVAGAAGAASAGTAVNAAAGVGSAVGAGIGAAASVGGILQ